MSIFNYASHKLGLDKKIEDVPLKLHPGSRFEISETPFIFAEADNSFIKNVLRSAEIEMLGYYQQGDLRVFRCYFDDQSSFIEIPVKENTVEPIHIRVFKTFNEDFPDDNLRDLLLGDEPLIGWVQFQFNDSTGNPKETYDRSWMAGTNVPKSVRPFQLIETLMDKTKKEIQHDSHQIMLYQRDLPNFTEYLYTDYVNQKRSDGQEADVFRTFIGIDISSNDVKVYA